MFALRVSGYSGLGLFSYKRLGFCPGIWGVSGPLGLPTVTDGTPRREVKTWKFGSSPAARPNSQGPSSRSEGGARGPRGGQEVQSHLLQNHPPPVVKFPKKTRDPPGAEESVKRVMKSEEASSAHPLFPLLPWERSRAAAGLQTFSSSGTQPSKSALSSGGVMADFAHSGRQ